MIASSELRLSAVRAFLGRIYPEIRLVKIKAINNTIKLTVVTDKHPTEEVREEISVAATEIIADFAAASKILEELEVSTEALPKENAFDEGWIFQRA